MLTDGALVCVPFRVVGAPHGADAWVQIDAMSTPDLSSPLSLNGAEMSVKLPFAGIFCAFSSPDVEDSE